MQNLSDDFMTVTDIRRKLGVNNDTIYSMLQSGELRGIRMTPRGRWIVRRADYEAKFGNLG